MYKNKYLKYKNKYLELRSNSKYLNLFSGIENDEIILNTENKNKFLNLRKQIEEFNIINEDRKIKDFDDPINKNKYFDMKGGTTLVESKSNFTLSRQPITIPKLQTIISENKTQKNASGNPMSDLNFNKWDNYINIKSSKMGGEYIFDIIEKNGSIDGPILVVMAGISTRSFCSTSQVITKNLDKLLTKFSRIYMINLNTFKTMQNDSCKARDRIDSPDIPTKFAPEIEFNKLCGKIIDHICHTLELSNVHLLGKCAGGGIAIQTVIQSDIYKALYLAVPASPTNIQPILDSDKPWLKKLIYHFSWTKDDPDGVSWGGLSRDQKDVYDAAADKLSNYSSCMCETGFHEVADEFIKKIIQ